MDKLWIVFLFLGVFLLINNFAKRLLINFIVSGKDQSNLFVPAEEKDDPKVFWNSEGFRREPEQAEFVLPEEDFFGDEKTELSESFENEFSGLSEKETEEILKKAGLYEKKGEA